MQGCWSWQSSRISRDGSCGRRVQMVVLRKQRRVHVQATVFGMEDDAGRYKKAK